MKKKLLATVAVIAMTTAIAGFKDTPSTIQTAAAASPPRILLAAPLSEANKPGDGCAELIHIVRAAHDRGVAVREVNVPGKSRLLARYHILAIPTLLIFSKGGKEIARYTGERPETIKAVRTAIEGLK